jgi:hypothetical protein
VRCLTDYDTALCLHDDTGLMPTNTPARGTAAEIAFLTPGAEGANPARGGAGRMGQFVIECFVPHPTKLTAITAVRRLVPPGPTHLRSLQVSQ